jgi:hypothetical protein
MRCTSMGQATSPSALSVAFKEVSADVAQLVERAHGKGEVAGSTPAVGSYCRAGT